MGKFIMTVALFMLSAALTATGQNTAHDDEGKILALENAWNHAVEAKDSSAVNMILASAFVSVDIDGSVSSRSEYLASLKSPDYQPSQAVTEQSNVQVYGNAAVVVGIYREKGWKKESPSCIASDLWIPGSKPTGPGNAWHRPAR